MPPSAAATFPSVVRTAPVNAPFAWPNSSLSSNSADRLGQWTVTNGPPARRLRAWTARASTPLPVPLSPRRRTVASLGGDREHRVQRLPHRPVLGAEVEHQAAFGAVLSA